MNHQPRRARSPPFGYDPRMMPNSRPEYEDPYHPANQFNGPPAQALPAQPPIAPPPYMPNSPHSQGYPMSYRDHHRLPSTYRDTLIQREPYPPVNVPPSVPVPQRAGSPPYKILCITNINPKIGDGPVKDALANDYCRFGDISVSICHDSGERLAYIYFRNYEEAREARHAKSRTLFFDRPVDIEPIYEPIIGTDGSPIESSPPPPIMAPPVHPMYSSRRRSMTPPEYLSHDFNGQMMSRRHPPPYPHMHKPTQPQSHHQRGMSPVDYPRPTTHMGNYPSVNSPPPAASHDRRGSYGSSYGHPTHLANPNSPYSSPPHEPYRSPYPQQYSSSQSNPPPPYAGPYVGPMQYPMGRERDRVPMRSRSPRGDPYYQRGGFYGSHYHPTSRTSSQYSSSHHSSSYRSPPQTATSHHYPPDPPARYFSREFRREKFGADHLGSDHDDGRPSRVLLVNNIDANKTESDLRDTFEPYGIIEEMEVKKVSSDISSALIKFSSMDGAYKAKTANNGRHIGNLRCRIVYGKVSASRRLWIGGLSPATTVPCLEDECGKFGDITNMDYTSGRPYAYVEYETANQAQFAAHHLRISLTPASDRKIRIEFVDPERSEKIVSGNDSNSQVSTDTGSKSRGTNESWATSELEPSPQSISGASGQKRSLTPTELTGPKRPCQTDDLPPGTSIFKQERLAAVAAAAKARTSSSTSSVGSHPNTIDDQSEVVLKQNVETNNNGSQKESTTESCGASKSNEQYKSDIKSPQHDDGSLGEVTLHQCTSIREIVECCPVYWPSQIALRNFVFPARIYMCSGRKQVIDRYLMIKTNNIENGNNTCQLPLLRITQRWRLHPQPKLEEVKKRMQAGNLGILIITSRSDNDLSMGNLSTSGQQVVVKSSSNEQKDGQTDIADNKHADRTESERNGTPGENSTPNPLEGAHNITASPSSSQSRPLRNLISYLEQKDAAGVISLSPMESGAGATDQVANESGANSKLLYAFPPGDFALNLIRRHASNISAEATKEEFLLGVIVGGTIS